MCRVLGGLGCRDGMTRGGRDFKAVLLTNRSNQRLSGLACPFSRSLEMMPLSLPPSSSFSRSSKEEAAQARMVHCRGGMRRWGMPRWAGGRC